MKCPCCGSRQFQTVATKRICSYCRSEQDAERVDLIEVTSLEDTEPRFIQRWQANSLKLRAERYIDYFGTNFVRYSRNMRAAKGKQS